MSVPPAPSAPFAGKTTSINGPYPGASPELEKFTINEKSSPIMTWEGTSSVTLGAAAINGRARAEYGVKRPVPKIEITNSK